MTHISYRLSMPNVGSWNGKWTDADKVFIRVRSYTPKDKRLVNIRARTSYYYDFGDGWGARISIEEVDVKEKQKRNKASAGFCNYDWMIDSIECKGRIEA